MGTMDIQKQRLIKKCKIVLGENFCPDFIYEDVDFTKPSTIKEAYKLFEANDLDEGYKVIGRSVSKREQNVIFKQVASKVGVNMTVRSGGSMLGDSYMFKSDKDADAFADGLVKHLGAFDNRNTAAGTQIPGGVFYVDYIQAPKRANGKWYVVAGFNTKFRYEADDLEEADAADGAMKGIKAKERLNFIDNIMSTYEGKSLAFYKKILKKNSKFKDGKLTPYELSIIKREMKRQKQKSESTELEEANNRLKAHTPAAAQRLIKKLKNKFSGYNWDDMVKGDEIIKPNEPYIIRFIKKQPEVADMKESTNLEEAKNATVRTLRQMLFKIDSSAADKFRRELFNIDKQDSPATSAQIKKAKTIIGNRFGKDAFLQLESGANWIIYNKKTGKQLSPSKSWRKWQGAKAAASKIGGDAEVADVAWYRNNKAKLIGEAKSDKQQDIESLEKMIKNPDPRRFSQYGGKEGYLKMLNSKLAKLKA
jgi:DnaJ-domain-containing protein 1